MGWNDQPALGTEFETHTCEEVLEYDEIEVTKTNLPQTSSTVQISDVQNNLGETDTIKRAPKKNEENVKITNTDDQTMNLEDQTLKPNDHMMIPDNQIMQSDCPLEKKEDQIKKPDDLIKKPV